MYPSNEDEAARFLAQSQTSGVSDATFRRRRMRMVPEQPLMHLKPEAIRQTDAVSVVVDNGEDLGNTEGFSDKSTLLDVV